ncbi:hypothetical protein NKJ71_19555 [Mesorhizobium sp. M0050]
MARANFRRRKQSSRNVETQSLKVTPDSECARIEAGLRREHAFDVFDEDEPRAGLDDNAPGIGPKVAIVSATKTPAGGAVRLARDATNEAVHASTPAEAIKGFGIAPNRSLMQESRFHR